MNHRPRGTQGNRRIDARRQREARSERSEPEGQQIEGAPHHGREVEGHALGVGAGHEIVEGLEYLLEPLDLVREELPRLEPRRTVTEL